VQRLVQAVASVLSLAVLVPSPASAAEKSLSGTATAKRVVSRSISLPGDDPRHALVQTVREDALKSSDPAWDESTGLAYEQSDSVATGGSHRGYSVIRHKNGDETYLKYEGTAQVVGEGSAQEISIAGTLEVTGGTGRFKGVKGTGKYTGKAMAKGQVINWELTLTGMD